MDCTIVGVGVCFKGFENEMIRRFEAVAFDAYIPHCSEPGKSVVIGHCIFVTFPECFRPEEAYFVFAFIISFAICLPLRFELEAELMHIFFDYCMTISCI